MVKNWHNGLMALSVAAAMLLACPAASWAEESASEEAATTTEDKQQESESVGANQAKPALKPVLRGFYLGLQGGLSILPMRLAPGESALSYQFAPGGTFGFNLGYDFNDLISLQLQTFFGAYHGLNSEDASGKREDLLVNDMTTLGLRLALLVTVWHRPNMYMQVGAGFGILWMDDAMVIPYPHSMMADAIYNFEYYTKLRHFSVGVDVDWSFLFTPFNMNIQILPHLRYTF